MNRARVPLAFVHSAAPKVRHEYLSVPEPQLEDYEWRQDETVQVLLAALGLRELPPIATEGNDDV